MKKITTGISLSREFLKQIDTIAKKTGFSRSLIIEFLIYKYLPNSENEKELENFVIELAKFRIEMAKQNNKPKAKIILPKEINKA